MHANRLPGYAQSLGLRPGINSFPFCTAVTEPLILDAYVGPKINATRTPQLLYLDDSKHFRKGILGGGHGRQEAEEVVSRCIRKHLEIAGRVLWGTNTVSEKHSSARPHSRGYSTVMTGELPSPEPSDVLKPVKAPFQHLGQPA